MVSMASPALAGGGQRTPGGTGVSQPPCPPRTRRWECYCRLPPVLLATVDTTGTLNLKIRDRYYHIDGACVVRAVCPRCGRLHTLSDELGPAR